MPSSISAPRWSGLGILLTGLALCLVSSVRAAGPAAAAVTATSGAVSTVAVPTPAAVPAPSAALVTPTLYDLVVELARSDAMRRQFEATLRETADWKSLAAGLKVPGLDSELTTLEIDQSTLSRARYIGLVDADTRIRERVRTIEESTAALGDLARRVEADLERLVREAARWPQRAKLAQELEAPPGIQRRVDAAGPALASIRELLRSRRDDLLLAYEQGLDLEARLAVLRASIAERRERISLELRTQEGAPIWRERGAAFPRDEMAAVLRLARLELVDYLGQYGTRLLTLLALLSAFMVFVLRQRAAPPTPSEAASRQGPGLAIACALLSALVLVGVIAPRGPFVFYRLIGLAVPLLAGVVATKSFAASIPATAWALVLAVIVNEFRILAEMSPRADRLLLAVQLAPFLAALLHDWRRGALGAFVRYLPPVTLRRIVLAVVVAIAAAAVASMLGYGGFAHTLSALVVVAPGFMLVFAALAWALDQVVAGVLASPLARSLRSVRERGEALRRALHVVIVCFCWAIGVTAFTVAHSALDDLLRVGNHLANARVSAGEVTITMSAVLSALVVVGLTWLVTKVVRFVLDYELLPRFNLRTGVPIAISTIVGYVLVVTGFVLALAALGIDLTKVTLLAGALGVGVGLGLQSVVGNFVSGLTLMLERPINVGDEIDVGGIQGEVRRIGVRSSTLRTSQGAEVIVPNSDLASKQVVNWTLSDRARRYEIDVGVAYGSDPAQVLRLLEGAVADLKEVQKVPPPRALFAGFGESSLDFRLFAWVYSVDIGLQAQNSMRMAILHALDDAGIAIPFPQRDLNIRRSVPLAASAPAPRA